MRRSVRRGEAPPMVVAVKAGEQLAMDDELGEFVRGAPKKKSEGVSATSWRKAAARVQILIAQPTASWAQARPLEFVVLYAQMHLHVYGVECEVMGPRDRLDACRAAGSLMRQQFGGDPDAMLEFVKWAWKREAEREKWRRENPGQHRGGRVGWRLLFGGKMIVDYKLEKRRGR